MKATPRDNVGEMVVEANIDPPVSSLITVFFPQKQVKSAALYLFTFFRYLHAFDTSTIFLNFIAKL